MSWTASSSGLSAPFWTSSITLPVSPSACDKVVSETMETHRLRDYLPQEYVLFLEQAGFAMQSFSAFPSPDAPLTDQAWNAFVVATAQ
jgi:hypothetical protein